MQGLTLCVASSSFTLSPNKLKLADLPGKVGERPRLWSHHGRSDRNQRHADEEPDFAISGWENL